MYPSGILEASWLEAGIKPTLIKRYKNVLTVLLILTTALAILPTQLNGYVAEMQEPTYSPELVPDIELATTTQPEIEQVKINTPQPVRKYPGPSADARMPDLSKEEVIQLILEAFPDAPVMVRVAKCESGLDPYANRAGLNVDVGLFQINQVHLKTLTTLGLDRWDVYDNITYARILYDEQGLTPWHMSKSCWS